MQFQFDQLYHPFPGRSSYQEHELLSLQSRPQPNHRQHIYLQVMVCKIQANSVVPFQQTLPPDPAGVSPNQTNYPGNIISPGSHRFFF